jgi:hypothetical protein
MDSVEYRCCVRTASHNSCGLTYQASATAANNRHLLLYNITSSSKITALDFQLVSYKFSSPVFLTLITRWALVSALRHKLIYKFLNPIVTRWKRTRPTRSSHVQLPLLYLFFRNVTVFLFPADQSKLITLYDPHFTKPGGASLNIA